MSHLSSQLRFLEIRKDLSRRKEAGKLIQRVCDFAPGKRMRFQGRVIAVTTFGGHLRGDGTWKDEPEVTFLVDIGERFLLRIHKFGEGCYEKSDLGDGEYIEFSAVPEFVESLRYGDYLGVGEVVSTRVWGFQDHCSKGYKDCVGRFTVSLEAVRVNRKKQRTTPEYQFRKVVEGQQRNLPVSQARW